MRGMGVAVTATALFLSGCALLVDSSFPYQFSDHVEAKRARARAVSMGSKHQGSFSSAVGKLAAQILVKKAEGTIRKDLPIIVASFTDSDNLNITTGFGRMLSEQVSTELVNGGYRVIELRMRGDVYVTENGGEFLLSRKAKHLSKRYEAHAAVVGTYVVGHDMVFVNAKVIDFSSNTILAAYDFNVAIDKNVQEMLEKNPHTKKS